MKSSIVYKITYIPHLNTSHPKFYIGSKHNYTENRWYFGSVSSKQIFDYCNNMMLKDWWKLYTTQYPYLFNFEIINSYKCDAKTLLLYEYEYQKIYDISSYNYFNQSYATKNFCSKKNSPALCKIKSEKAKLFWNSDAGMLKKQRLSDRNKHTKSEELYSHMNNPDSKMSHYLRQKSEIKLNTYGNLINKEPETFLKKVKHNDIVYRSYSAASRATGIPIHKIRLLCMGDLYKNWNFIY